MSENPVETNQLSIPESAANLHDGDFDHEFIVQGERIPARKAVLASQSPVFSAEFDHQSNEITLFDTDTVITDVDFVVFKAFIDYLHTGLCPDIDNYPVDLLIVADRYCVEELCTKCEIVMLNTLNTYNAAHYLVVAMQLNRINLINSTVDFIKSESPHIFELRAWHHVAGNLDIMVGMIKLFYFKQDAVPEVGSRRLPHGSDLQGLALNGQNSVANDSSSIPSSSTAKQASRPRRSVVPINTLSWTPQTVTWTFDEVSASSGRELVSPLFFVIFPGSDSLCGYNLVFQPHKCVQCRTSFSIAVCQISPRHHSKLLGSMAGKDCTITNGCGKCISYSSPFPMRKLKFGEAGVCRVEYGRFERLSQFFFEAKFTFTLSESAGCRIDPPCCFVVSEEPIFCSSQTLATRSAYFAHLLQANSDSLYVLKDDCVTPEDFKIIVTYLTTNRLPLASKVNQVVLKMAKKFKLPHLFSVCDEMLAQQVSSIPASAVSYFTIGHQTGAPLLKESAKNCIKNNMEAIDDSDWNVLQDSPELLLELLMELV